MNRLAFVCIGPISYCWEQYAIWSKGLAREMLSYWAEGNSIASQALYHIRTVKAFGCESSVLTKYADTNQLALNCGIRDAWGNGITSALTGYLDLGTGVLILYFGGLLVYKNEMSVGTYFVQFVRVLYTDIHLCSFLFPLLSRIVREGGCPSKTFANNSFSMFRSIYLLPITHKTGDLVTYQLFWNMMNNSYQNLQGLITDFTRSAAGAEKVFSLWDSIPDIDPSKGVDINIEDIRGDIELKNVSFYYQMRPDNIVLNAFNLSIPAGKTLALVGRSGGGKSTIGMLFLFLLPFFFHLFYKMS